MNRDTSREVPYDVIPCFYEPYELRLVIEAMIDYEDRADVPPWFHETRLRMQINYALYHKKMLSGDEEHSAECGCLECRERRFLAGRR